MKSYSLSVNKGDNVTVSMQVLYAGTDYELFLMYSVGRQMILLAKKALD